MTHTTHTVGQSQSERISWFMIAAACFAALLIAPDVIAQTIPSITLGDLQDASNRTPDDASKRMLKGILGEDFATNPFSAAGLPATLMGNLFAVFNSIIFCMAAGLTGWLMITAIAEGAQDGEVLGKKGNGLWVPIRTGIGLLGTLPVLGGFSVFQGITMFCISLGIGAANLVTDRFILSVKEMQAITPSLISASSAPNLSSELKLATRGLFLSELCIRAQNVGLSAFIQLGDDPGFREPVLISTRREFGFDYGMCGSVIISKRFGATPRKGESDHIGIGGIVDEAMMGFRNNGVDYDSIAASVHKAAQQQLGQIKALTGTAAQALMNERYPPQGHTGGDFGGGIMRALATLDEIERGARTTLNNAIKSQADSAASGIKNDTYRRMKDGGWMNVGSFYSVFAESSAAIADAQKAWTIAHKPGLMFDIVSGKMSGPEAEVLNLFLMRADEEEVNGKSRIDAVLDAIGPDKNAAGERSLGQSIVNTLTEGLMKDSGGAGLVNPVVAAKNTGDWLMIAGQAMIGASVAAEAVPAGKAMKVAAKFSGLLSDLGELYKTIAFIFIGAGMFLSTYVPLLPWLIWIAAIVVYSTVILEAILYASLGAFSHIRLHGDTYVDKGGSAEKFYLYLLNVTLRPSLMVISFAIGCALVTYLGSFVLEGFGTAMSNVQGNSATGPLSIAAFVLIACVLIFGLVQHCFSLPIQLSDRFLGWIGGHADNNSGAIAGAAAGAALMRARGPSGGGGAAASAVTSPAKPKSE